MDVSVSTHGDDVVGLGYRGGAPGHLGTVVLTGGVNHQVAGRTRLWRGWKRGRDLAAFQSEFDKKVSLFGQFGKPVMNYTLRSLCDSAYSVMKSSYCR